MSPLWPDPYHLLLSPAGCRVVKAGETRQLDLDLPAAGGGALAAALATLSLPAAPRRARLAIELDDAWARFQLIRYPRGIRSAAERSAYLAAIFRQVFGLEAGWRMATEPVIGDEPMLAVALEESVLLALQGLAERHGYRLASVQPAFVARYNRQRPQVASHCGALASLSANRACLGLWQDGRWLAVRSQILAGDDALGNLLAQLLAGSGVTAGGTLYLAGGRRAPHGLPAGWQAHTLEDAA